ncbi:hypothetical protein M422DRAFT_244543 [Sphaerobolus stellatus SS14]|nr:hypothetical protein M422DRAFT_244543 [Sphaerobolus stellatus SS14]
MATSELIEIVNKLGGPEVTLEDVDWMTDLPVGKDVVEFLVSLATGDTALSDVALGKEERDIWQRAISTKAADPYDASEYWLGSESERQRHLEIVELAAEYLRSSPLESSISHIENEQKLLDEELGRLNHRISKLKEQSSQQSRTKKKVEAAQSQTSQLITDIEEILGELSSKADNTVSNTIKAACQLSNDKASVEQFLNFDNLSAILSSFNEAYSNLARILELCSDKHPRDSLGDADAIANEIARLSTNVTTLEGAETSPLKNHICDDWVFETARRAWSVEQSEELRSRFNILKQTSDILRNELIPLATIITSSLNGIDQEGNEILVVIQALLDELDDIQVDVEHSDAEPRLPWKSDELEARIRHLLRQLRTLRPPDLSPLTLVDYEDLKTEISGIHSRYEHVLTGVSEAVSTASQNASKLSSNARKNFSIILTPSQTNTVLPMAPSQLTQDEISKANLHIGGVTQTLGRIPERKLLEISAWSGDVYAAVIAPNRSPWIHMVASALLAIHLVARALLAAQFRPVRSQSIVRVWASKNKLRRHRSLVGPADDRAVPKPAEANT